MEVDPSKTDDNVQHFEATDPVWDFLVEDPQQEILAAISPEYMDFKPWQVDQDIGYSPTFHELFDHNQFFAHQPEEYDHQGDLQQMSDLEDAAENEQIGQLQDLLSQSGMYRKFWTHLSISGILKAIVGFAGLPSNMRLASPHEQTPQTKAKSVCWLMGHGRTMLMQQGYLDAASTGARSTACTTLFPDDASSMSGPGRARLLSVVSVFRQKATVSTAPRTHISCRHFCRLCTYRFRTTRA